MNILLILEELEGNTKNSTEVQFISDRAISDWHCDFILNGIWAKSI